MFIYWALFAYFAVGTMVSPKEGRPGTRLTPLLLFGAVVTAILIGFRYKVGGDWQTYEFFFSSRRGGPNAPPAEDPGYQAVNWIVQHLQLDIWGVNFVCGAIFTWGLFRFCLVQTDPWLSALIAIPYMVIVVAMGYTRQAVALGILMAGLASVSRGGSALRFSVYTAIAALFHRTAVVALPITALSTQRNRIINAIIGIAGGVLLYDVFLGNAMDKFVQNYIHTGYSSSGAGIRLAMNFVAAAILTLANYRLRFNETEWKLWRSYSWASLLLLILLFISPSSTAVDRMSIYVMPLQIAVLSRVPLLWKPETIGRMLVILYLAAVQFVWLNFAVHANLWVPYRFFPL
ncbi:MAG TPA: EpsG family protein [Sphingomicrobium sp.]|nr:EpsG family protein [Sphingomicrobium sp.]